MKKLSSFVDKKNRRKPSIKKSLRVIKKLIFCTKCNLYINRVVHSFLFTINAVEKFCFKKTHLKF